MRAAMDSVINTLWRYKFLWKSILIWTYEKNKQTGFLIQIVVCWHESKLISLTSFCFAVLYIIHKLFISWLGR
jgi:hypothetical protein